MREGAEHSRASCLGQFRYDGTDVTQVVPSAHYAAPRGRTWLKLPCPSDAACAPAFPCSRSCVMGQMRSLGLSSHSASSGASELTLTEPRGPRRLLEWDRAPPAVMAHPNASL